MNLVNSSMLDHERDSALEEAARICDLDADYEHAEAVEMMKKQRYHAVDLAQDRERHSRALARVIRALKTSSLEPQQRCAEDK